MNSNLRRIVGHRCRRGRRLLRCADGADWYRPAAAAGRPAAADRRAEAQPRHAGGQAGHRHADRAGRLHGERVRRAAGAAHDGLRAKRRSVRQLARGEQHHGVARREQRRRLRIAQRLRAGRGRSRGVPVPPVAPRAVRPSWRPPPAPAPAAVRESRQSTVQSLAPPAPACVPPPPFANRGPGTVAAPFGMAFHDGYLYVGNTGSSSASSTRMAT